MNENVNVNQGPPAGVDVLALFGVEEIPQAAIPVSQVGRKPGSTGGGVLSPWAALVDHAIAIAPQGRGVRFALPEGRNVKTLRNYLYEVARRRNVRLSVTAEGDTPENARVYVLVLPGEPRRVNRKPKATPVAPAPVSAPESAPESAPVAA